MFKKTLYLLSVISLSSQALTSSLTEDVSFYAPHRMGYAGGIQTVSLENVSEGPLDAHLQLKEEIGKVLSGHMKFNERTEYGHYDQRGRWTPFTNFEDSDVTKLRLSTFAIARLTYDSYLDCSSTLPEPFRSHALRRLNAVKIVLNPNDQSCIVDNEVAEKNAYYLRQGSGGQGVINFCRLSIPHTASFFDVPAHETGHAILDALQSIFNVEDENHPYSAFHEAFGDLSAVFASARVATQHNNPHALVDFLESDTCLCVANGWEGPGSCLRRSCDRVTSATCEAHDKSVAFTKFYGEAMRYAFEDLRPTIENAEKRARYVFTYFQKLLVASAMEITNFDSLLSLGQQIQGLVPAVFKSQQSKNDYSPIIQHSIQDSLKANSKRLQACNTVSPAPLANMARGYQTAAISQRDNRQSYSFR